MLLCAVPFLICDLSVHYFLGFSDHDCSLIVNVVLISLLASFILLSLLGTPLSFYDICSIKKTLKQFMINAIFMFLFCHFRIIHTFWVVYITVKSAISALKLSFKLNVNDFRVVNTNRALGSFLSDYFVNKVKT